MIGNQEIVEDPLPPPNFGDIGYRVNGILGGYPTKSKFELRFRVDNMSGSIKMLQDPSGVFVGSFVPKYSFSKDLAVSAEISTEPKKLVSIGVSGSPPFMKRIGETKFSASIGLPLQFTLGSELKAKNIGFSCGMKGLKQYYGDFATGFKRFRIGAHVETADAKENETFPIIIKTLDWKISYNEKAWELSAGLSKLGKCFTVCFAQNVNRNTSFGASIAFEAANEKDNIVVVGEQPRGIVSRLPRLEAGVLHRFDSNSAVKAKLSTDGIVSILGETITASKTTKISFCSVLDLLQLGSKDIVSAHKLLFQITFSPN